MYMHNLRGEQGGAFINSTDVTIPDTGASYWAAFMVIEDAVLSAVTLPGFTNSDVIIGPTLFAGQIFYGRIDSITLASGSVQMFNYTDPNKVRG